MHVVALHAHPFDRRIFGPLTDLAAQGYLGKGVKVFAPDLRGRGTSRHPRAEVHGMDLLADDVAKDVAELLPEGEPFVLLGHSLGGYVALELLRRHGARFRGRLRGLALCDTKASVDDEAGKVKRREAIAAMEREGMAAPLRDTLPKLLWKGSLGSSAHDLAKAMVLATPPETAIADQRGMLARSEGFDVLAALHIPALVLCGEEDSVTPASEAEAMTEVLSQAPYVALVTVPEAGHLAPLEKPHDVARALAALLGRAA